MKLEIPTPEWAEPLLEPCRYKGAKGGRGSGKSHFFAEYAVEEMVADPDLYFVCIREVQKSLKFSAKILVEEKIRRLGVSHLFDVTATEIRRIGGKGVMIFQGMQDHTADSIKSLEGFKRAWVEEAQSLSYRSLKLLRPTIRSEGSEIWFSWNPEQPEDSVDAFFRDQPDDSVCVHVNSTENPFLPETLRKERESDKRRLDPEEYAHIWEGAYNRKSDEIVFSGKYQIADFEPGEDWHGPYNGLDFGFANDPTAAVKCWIHADTLYIEHEAGAVGLELDSTAQFITSRIPDFQDYTIRADSARPESISYLKRKGLPYIKGVKKGSGSVEDGIDHIKSYVNIVIHPRCEQVQKEFRLYSYKVDRKSGDVLPKLIDANNHYIDAIRYALEPIISNKGEQLYFV